ncbi:MAG: hypothetical protein ABW321_14105 [Polyangiales bacterium]
MASSGSAGRGPTSPTALDADDDRSVIGESLAATRPQVALPEPREYYRIDIAREAGTITHQPVQRVTLTSLPLPSFVAEYVLTAVGEPGAAHAVPLSFSTQARSFGFDTDNRWVEPEPFELTDTRATAFIPVDAVREGLALLDAAGNAVLSIPQTELPTGQGAGAGDGDGNDAAAALRARYPNIHFLRRGDEQRVPQRLLMSGTIVEEIPLDYATILDEALGQLEPVVRNAISSLAVVDYPSVAADEDGKDYPAGYTLGPQIVLALGMSDDLLRRAVPHEAAHTFWNAINQEAVGETKHPDMTSPLESLIAARERIAHFKLLAGIEVAWTQLHESGVQEGLASHYPLPQGADYNAAVAGGFFSTYGGSLAAEDFAEYASGLAGAPHGDKQDPCARFRDSKGAEPTHAIAFAKSMLLAGLGVVSQASFDTCIGDYSVIPQDPGIVFFRAGAIREGLHAGYEQQPGSPRSFNVRGFLDPFQFVIAVRLGDARGSAVGLHRLDAIQESNVSDAFSKTHVAVVGTSDANALASRSGLLLITEATSSSAKGVIFGLTLQNEAGAVDTIYPLVTFNVPSADARP